MQQVQSYVESAISSKHVVLFVKSDCEYSAKTEELFTKYYLDVEVISGDDLLVVTIDETEYEYEEIREYLSSKTGDESVPCCFVDQQFIGGQEQIQQKHDSGDLQKILKSKN